MASTVIRGAQIKDSTVQRHDLDTSTVGQAVVTKLIQGSGITLSSTGADSGTGDVTVSGVSSVSTDAGNIATLGSDSLILVPQQTIWSTRLRSFNAIGNPTFEVDQKNVGGMVAGVANNIGVIDRWRSNKAGATMVVNQGTVAAPVGTVVVPGTNFCITSRLYRFLLTTQQASLAAGDVLGIFQSIEGPRWRELSLDVHSVSLIVRTGVAGLKFSVALRDNASSQTLVKLCTVPSADTFTLIQLPNLPLWPSGGTFSSSPGVFSYAFLVILAAGSSLIAPAADTWQAGSFNGAPGMSNFAASPVNSYFDIAFVQHEPGPLCTTPIDCSFGQNLDGEMGCLRYFQKSAPYGSAPNAVQAAGALNVSASATVNQYFGFASFRKVMAKAPAVTLYSTTTGAANTVRNNNTASDLALGAAGTLGIGDSGFSGFQLTAAATLNNNLSANWAADTGW